MVLAAGAKTNHQGAGTGRLHTGIEVTVRHQTSPLPDESETGTRPLRILQLTTSYEIGGVARHILDLRNKMQQNGHTVWLGGSPGTWLAPGASGFLPLPIDLVTANGGSPQRRARSFLAAAYRLRRWLRDHPVDVVHTHEVAPAYVARLAATPSGPPVVFSFHGCEEGREEHYARAARRVAAHVVVPAARLGRPFRAQGFHDDRLSTVRYPVSRLPDVGTEEVLEARRGLGVSPEGHLVLTVARLDRQKGIDKLVEACHRIDQLVGSDREIVFAVVGGGPLEDKIRKQIDRAGLGARFRLLGPVPTRQAFNSLLHGADLFVLPSRWEALPIVIVEAFQAGCPVIATDVGGVADLVDESVGRLVPSNAPDPLANAILSLLSDPVGLRRRGEEARTRACDPALAIPRIHAAYESIYRRVSRSTEVGAL
jgi:glycosyltransferase involved in cell wall biosynthesis